MAKISTPYKSIIFWVKLVWLLVSVAYVAYVVGSKPILLDWFMVHSNGFLLLVLGFMLINWGLEALKWRILLQNIHPLSFATALKGVWIGLMLGVFTPNRLGESLARLWVIDTGKRLQVLTVTFVGSYAQGLITLVAGWLGLWLLMRFDDTTFWINQTYTWILTIVFTMLAGMGYFLLPKLWNISVFKRIHAYVRGIRQLTNSQLVRVLALALMRYSIFTFQFALLLAMWAPHVEFEKAWAGVSALYFLSSFVPNWAFSEVFSRSAIALVIFEPLGYDATVVIAANACIWIVNVAVPALIGAFLFLIEPTPEGV